MEWDSGLESKALAWADNCWFDHWKEADKSQPGEAGQVLMASPGPKDPNNDYVLQAVHGWYNEEPIYRRIIGYSRELTEQKAGSLE